MLEQIKTLSKKKKILLVLGCIFIITKLMICMGLPVYIIQQHVNDDGWCITEAFHIRKGDWMGDYTSITLSKGCFFPFFLALCNLLGVSYQFAVAVLYIIGVLVLTYAISMIIKSDIIRFVFFSVLLFNPASMCVEGYQRVYRTAIIQPLVMIVIGCTLVLFFRRKNEEGSMIWWSITGALSFAAFWLTREDTIWLVPFQMFFIILMEVYLLNEVVHKRMDWKKLLKKTVIYIMPLIVTVMAVNVVREVNYKKYGVAFANDCEDGSYPECIAAMRSVKTDDDIERVSITKNDLETLYTISPTLNSISNILDKTLQEWDIFDANIGDGSVEDGWFIWAFRSAVEQAGYYDSPSHAEQFYQSVVNEINNAINSGIVEQREGVLPSAWVSPWRKQYMSLMMTNLKDCIMYTTGFQGIEAANIVSQGEYEYLLNVQALTQSQCVMPAIESYQSDWSIHRVNLINSIRRIYEIFEVLSLVSVVIYLVITVKLIIGAIKKRVYRPYYEQWSCLSGIIGSYAVLVVGITYTHISSFRAIASVYLIAAYPLIIIFNIIAMGLFIQRVGVWWHEAKMKRADER